MKEDKETKSKKQHRKRSISVSLPMYQADELQLHKNYSQLITKLLEENWPRITSQSIEKQLEIETERVLEIIEDVLADATIRAFRKIRVDLDSTDKPK